MISLPLVRLLALPRHWKQSALLVLDLCSIPVAITAAIIICWGGTDYPLSALDLIVALITQLSSAFIFLRIGLYRAIIRFMGQQAILTVLKGVTISSLVLAATVSVTASNIPVFTSLVYWAIALILIGGTRLLVRSFYHGVLRKSGDKVAIYGAGASGRQLLSALLPMGTYCPVVFIDDEPSNVGSVINGVSVYSSDQLPELVREFAISHVFLAMPSVDHFRRKEIIDVLEGLHVHVKTVPDFYDLMSGDAKVTQLQDIELADLLGRDPIPPDPMLIEKCIFEKVVMVTGAGGSIGSELCRQIIRCRPKELILFDISEHALYQISKELDRIKHHGKDAIHITPLLGSAQNQKRLESIFTEFAVDTVYHAAAYKHVPMVEYNIVEGVLNNVFGTLAAGQAAVRAGVDNFVLISTDKAVRPTNVMGASKRMAELICQTLAVKHRGTDFCMVRFGNVLGSSGSVVPLFRQQIHNGGPVTVTHKDIVRYFMTMEEAAQLVLQASAMGKGGDVFVLDMGAPVKIESLARRLIRLMGAAVKDEAHPHGEIEILFTGLRPGEKLYEELLLGDNVTGTSHPKIMKAEEELLPENDVDKYISALQQACDANDCEAIQSVLLDVVDGFDAKDGISDAMWNRRLENGGSWPRLETEATVLTGNFPKA